MHILHVLDHSIPLHSGYTFRTKSILMQQRARGWQTSHITSYKHQQALTDTTHHGDSQEIDGLEFYRTTVANDFLLKLPIVNQWEIVRSLERRLCNVIEQIKPDIIHAHSPALNGLAAIRAARKYALPVVYECRAFWEDAAVDHGSSKEWGLRYLATRALESHVFKNAQHITTICEGLRKEILSRGIVGPDNITVIQNAVELEQFDPDLPRDDELAATLHLENTTVLGFIGSFYAYEGLEILIDAMADLREKHGDLRLLLVGGGPEGERLQQKVHSLGLQDVVLMPGRVPHAEVQRYYSVVDIFVYPRHHMRLTDLVTPLKPLEAMAQKRLVVASDVGGHRELIDDGRTGRLFKAGRTDDLIHVLESLLSDRSLWPDILSAARTYVESERTWGNSVGRYETVYNSIISV